MATLQPGDIAILENTRFHAGEEKNDPALASAMAAIGDLYVNDAFSAAHRAHASTEALAHLLPAFAGRAMEAELDALEAALGNPERPVAAVVGGAKVSTKLDVLTPPRRQGRPSHHRRRHGQHLPRRARRRRRQVACASTIWPTPPKRSSTPPRRPAAPCICPMTWSSRRSSRPIRRAFASATSMRSAPDEMILDIGPAAVEALADVLKTCRTLVWNGPLGAFETPPFDAATRRARAHCGGADPGGQPGLGRRRRRHCRGAEPGRRRQRISHSSRPQAAPSSNGWKAGNCPALPRFNDSKLDSSRQGQERCKTRS